MATYIYIRYSCSRQKAESAEIQEQRCRAYAQMKGLAIDGIYRDLEISGKHRIDKRPEGGRMVRALSAGDVVIAKCLDRLTRNSDDINLITKKWSAAGISVHFADQGGASFDASTAMGRFIIKQLIIIAELERETIGERTSAAIQHRRSKNMVCPGKIPYGWRRVRGSDTLIECEHEQEVIEKAKALRDENVSLRQIGERLVELGYLPRSGGEWGPSQIRSMVG